MEYEDLREKMFRIVEEKFLSGERAKEVRKERAGKVRLMNAIIGDGVANTSAAVAVRKAALNYCMKRRNAIVVQHSPSASESALPLAKSHLP